MVTIDKIQRSLLLPEFDSLFTDSYAGNVKISENGDFEFIIDEHEEHRYSASNPYDTFTMDSLKTGTWTDWYYLEITDGQNLKM